MFLLLDDDQEVSIDTVVLCSMSFTLDCHLHSAFNSCRNLDLDGLTLAYKSGSRAGRTRIAYNLALSAALLAGGVCHHLAAE